MEEEQKPNAFGTAGDFENGFRTKERQVLAFLPVKTSP
jgi:hypothetical protein